jgi:hypothetical protein
MYSRFQHNAPKRLSLLVLAVLFLSAAPAALPATLDSLGQKAIVFRHLSAFTRSCFKSPIPLLCIFLVSATPRARSASVYREPR